MPPLITRGILIDVAGFKGVEYLEAGYAIQPAELDSALAAQGTEVKKGDTVLVHTGWGRFWSDAAKTLSGNRVSVVRVQNGQSTTISFAGVATSLQSMLYPSKRKARRCQCISKCLRRLEFG